MAHLPLHGFSLLRNGRKYDYPFIESLKGLRDLCESVTVALGRSEDGTEDSLNSMSLEITPTVWDEEKRKGGEILSEQTNIALQELRSRSAKGWGFYLQADEAISEQDFPLIREDLARAEAEGCDCISFRYIHFWQSYERIAVGKRWYPQEIRCIRLDSAIESYGDAQSFRGWKKRYESNAVIYHYGHVREAEAYDRKKKDFHRWWHPDHELASVIARGETGDRREETLAYFGPHPIYMVDRITKQGGLSPLPWRTVKVFGNREEFSREFLSRIQSAMEWLDGEKKIFENRPEDVVLLRPLSPLGYLRSMGKLKSRVPRSMGSPQARPWSPEFQAILRFSEKNIRIR